MTFLLKEISVSFCEKDILDSPKPRLLKEIMYDEDTRESEMFSLFFELKILR